MIRYPFFWVSAALLSMLPPLPAGVVVSFPLFDLYSSGEADFSDDPFSAVIASDSVLVETFEGLTGDYPVAPAGSPSSEPVASVPTGFGSIDTISGFGSVIEYRVTSPTETTLDGAFGTNEFLLVEHDFLTKFRFVFDQPQDFFSFELTDFADEDSTVGWTLFAEGQDGSSFVRTFLLTDPVQPLNSGDSSFTRLGFVAKGGFAFSRVEFTVGNFLGNGTGDRVGIDNVRYGGAVIPEPSRLAGLLTWIAIVGGLAFRRACRCRRAS